MLRLKPCERQNILIFLFLQNLEHILFCTYSIYTKYCVIVKYEEFREKIWNIRNKTIDLVFRPKYTFLVSKRMFLPQNPVFWIYHIYIIFKARSIPYIFCIYRYCIKIEYLFLQNNSSDSNFNCKFDYDYGMQGLS